MIDKTKKYWTGSNENDIDEWLKLYVENEIDIKPVICNDCHNTEFEIKVDQDEGAIQVKCTKCGKIKLLLNSEEVWEFCEPKQGKCSCKSKKFNVRVGFQRRLNGVVKWVYIGNRCTKCGTLGSFVDWKIDFEPTNELEEKI